MSILVWGMILIVVAWLFQLFSSMRGKRDLQPSFLILYSLGVLLFVVDGFSGGVTSEGLLNVAALFLALLVWFKVKR